MRYTTVIQTSVSLFRFRFRFLVIHFGPRFSLRLNAVSHVRIINLLPLALNRILFPGDGNMNGKQLDQFLSEDGGSAESSPASDTGKIADHKPPFVKPALICNGTVFDLTSTLGGKYHAQ